MSDAALPIEAPLQAVHEPWEGLSRQREAVLFGMWVFLASELLLFASLFCGWFICRHLDPGGFTAAARHANLMFGATNTVLLMTSSVAIAIAGRANEAERERLAELCIWLTVALGLAFLVVKGLEYREDLSEGLWPRRDFPVDRRGAELFWGFYWVMTGLHVCHLLIGIGLITRLGLIARRGRLARHADSVEVSALYWGLVDVIWIALYPLIYLSGR